MPLPLSPSRSPIKKSMSDRSSTSSEYSTSPKTNSYHHHHHHHHQSMSSNSDLSAETTPKKFSSAFHFLDSILTRSISKPLTIKNMQKKSSACPSSSSCPQASFLSTMQIPSEVRCLYSYNAMKDDEICINRGENVHVITHDQDNRWFVRRHAQRLSPSIQGWLPGSVLGLKHPNPSTNHHLSPSALPASSLSSNSLNQF
jgi:hypothetical protein